MANEKEGFSDFEQEWFDGGNRIDEHTERMLEDGVPECQDMDGNPVFVSKISGSARIAATLILSAFLANACATRQTLNVAPYGGYFKKMEVKEAEKYGASEDFGRFLDAVLEMNFDKNISDKDLELLRREVAKLKAKNPIFQIKYKAKGEGRYLGYGSHRRFIEGEDVFEPYDRGISADDFQKTFEAAKVSCDEALSSLEDVLKEVADCKKVLEGKDPDQKDYDQYYDALKRAGLALGNALKVFPLANAYVLSDTIMMMAEYGVSTQDLNEVGVDLSFLEETLCTNDQQIKFRQYLLGSFEDDVENGNYDLDFLARSVGTFVVAAGLDTRELMAQMKTIVSDMKRKKDNEKKFGGTKVKDGSSVKDEANKQAEDFDPDVLSVKKFLEGFEEMIPVFEKFFGQGAKECLTSNDTGKIIRHAKDFFKFRGSERYLKFKSDCADMMALFKGNPSLEEKLNENEWARFETAQLALMATEVARINILNRIMTLGNSLSQADRDVYKGASLDVLYSVFDNLKDGYLDSLFDNFRLLEEGKYDLDLFIVDFVEATMQSIPLAIAVEGKVREMEKNPKAYPYVEIQKLREIIVVIDAMTTIEQKLNEKMGARAGGGVSLSPRDDVQKSGEGAKEIDLPTYSDFNEFNAEVLKGKGAYLVEVMNSYCPACRASEEYAIGPYLEGDGRGIKVVRINTESVDKKLGNWVMKSGFESAIPHYFVVRGGKVIGQQRGAFKSKEELIKFLNGVLGMEV